MTPESRSWAKPAAGEKPSGPASPTGTRRILILVVMGGIVSLLAVALLAYYLGQRAERRNTQEAPNQVLVRRVVSGHYARLDDKQELLYIGMRTPYSNEPLHDEAKKRNEQLVEGKVIRLEYEKKPRDKDGRLLAYAYVGDAMVNETLVKEGLGFVQAARGEKKYRDRLLSAQKDARQRRLGVWAAMGPSNESSYVGNSHEATFHRPACSRAAEIKSDRLVTFKTKDEAFDKGYAPCRHCLP